MRSKRTCLIFILLVMLVITSCVEVPSGRRLPIDLEVDTGEDLQRLIDGTMADLKRAEKIAGEVAGDTIKIAIDELRAYSKEVGEIFFAGLDTTISSLDAVLQARCLWIQSYTEQVHRYALDIIHATGDEADRIIAAATDGMLRVINETELAAERTTVVAIRGMVFVVDTVAERTLAIGGIAAGLLLTFICAFGWGRLIYQRQLPSVEVQRSLALGLMAVSLAFSLVPFTMLIPPVRAYALTSAGRGTALEIPAGRPSVYRFVPDPLVVPIPARTPQTLAMEGSSLTAMGNPAVTFGDRGLEVTGATDHDITIDIGPVVDEPQLDKTVKVQFGTDPGAVHYAVAVWTATPPPPPVRVPDVRGKTVEEARDELTAVGLSVVDETIPEPHWEIPKDEVTRTEPERDTEVKPGTEVTLYVSTGEPTITVPEVAGRPVQEAIAELNEAGFSRVRTAYESHEKTGKGLVIRTDPEEGSSHVVGSDPSGLIVWIAPDVTLYVSRGPMCEVKTQYVPEEDAPKEKELPTVPLHPELREGDRDFEGHGPEVTVRVTVYVDYDHNELKAEIYMSAEETDHEDTDYVWRCDPVVGCGWMPGSVSVEGDTKAYRTTTVTLWRPDPGWEIRRLIGDDQSSVTYTDENTDPDPHTLEPGEPVQKFVIIGDTPGPDVGQKDGDTGVTVYFNPLEVELINTEDCAAVRVTVSFTEIAIHDDEGEGEIWLDFEVGGQTGRWPPWLFEVMSSGGTYSIDKVFGLVLTEQENLVMFVNGTEFDILSPNDPMGTVWREFVSANEWGKGSHSDTSIDPDNYTIDYTIDVEWLP